MTDAIDKPEEEEEETELKKLYNIDCVLCCEVNFDDLGKSVRRSARMVLLLLLTRIVTSHLIFRDVQRRVDLFRDRLDFRAEFLLDLV